MLRFVQSLFGGLAKLGEKRSSSPVTRKARLEVEGMEDRTLLSAASLLHHPKHLVHHRHHHHKPALVTVNPPAPIQIDNLPPLVLNVPDMTGDKFVMQSQTNGTVHTLVIQSQSFNGDGSANFTGTWDGGAAVADGHLEYGLGGVHVTFTWGNGSHSFDGVISGSEGSYHIDGQVTVTGGGGPGHVVGNENLIPNLTGLTFDMKSLDNGTSHTLAIQSETFNADGSASFTGLWDGGAVVSGGSMWHDASTHIEFNWGNGTHSFDGHITFGVGTSPLPRFLFGWTIDGQVTVQGGGGPGHVTGTAISVPVLAI
jgi:hypothetical protein